MLAITPTAYILRQWRLYPIIHQGNMVMTPILYCINNQERNCNGLHIVFKISEKIQKSPV